MLHWAAYHASRHKALPTKKILSAVLPLFFQAANNCSMMKHSLDIALKITDFLNFGQISIA